MRELVEKRTKRSIAIVLSAKEREADRHLSPEVQARLRKVIIDQFNELASLSIDIIESLDGGGVVNELFVEKLNEIHSVLVG